MITHQDCIYLSEKLQMICVPSEMLAVRMCLSSLSLTRHRVHRFYKKLKEICDSLPCTPTKLSTGQKEKRFQHR